MIFLPIATTFTTPWFWQKNIFLLLLLRSLRYDYDKKNKLFFIPTLLSLHSYHEDKILFCYCYYVHYAMITTRDKPIPFQYYLHYTVVMMSQLSIVKLFLRKSSVSKRFVHDTVVSPSGTSVESHSIFFHQEVQCF